MQAGLITPQRPRVTWRRLRPLFKLGGAALLWLATLLFTLQVGLHAGMPDGMSMPEMIGELLVSSKPVGVPDMHMGMPVGGNEADLDKTGHVPPSSPGHNGARHAAEGLCCMTPVAVLPAVWRPGAAPVLGRVEGQRKAVREAQLILRATARGPPTS